MLDELLASYPDFSEAWYLRGVVCFCVGNYRQAQDACWQALATNRHHFAAHRLIARCWLEQEDSIKAVSAFERSFALNPSQHDVKGYIDVLKKRTRDVNIDDPQ